MTSKNMSVRLKMLPRRTKVEQELPVPWDRTVLLGLSIPERNGTYLWGWQECAVNGAVLKWKLVHYAETKMVLLHLL